MEIQKALTSALVVLRQYGLNDWTVRASRSKNTAGHCTYGRKEIALSKHWMEILSDEEVIDTILHEVAHAMSGYAASHGPVWRDNFIRIGGSGEAKLFSPNVRVTSKYTGKCPGGHIKDLERHAVSKHMKSRNIYCKKCMNEGRSEREAAIEWFERATMKNINERVYA